MTLRKALFLFVGGLVCLFFVAGEVLHHRAGADMAAVCAEMPAGRSPQMGALCTNMQTAQFQATVARWLQAAMLLGLLLLGVHLLLRNYVDRPAQALREHFRRMALGQWTVPLPAPALAAPSDLPAAITLLGVQMESAFVQLEAATRRSALALLVNNTEHQLNRIAESVEGVQVVVEAARSHRQLVPPQVVDNLKLVSRLIGDLQRSMNAKLEKEMQDPFCLADKRNGEIRHRGGRRPSRVA